VAGGGLADAGESLRYESKFVAGVGLLAKVTRRSTHGASAVAAAGEPADCESSVSGLTRPESLVSSVVLCQRSLFVFGAPGSALMCALLRHGGKEEGG
jgi:hypothetical protein